jgi:Fic family protein
MNWQARIASLQARESVIGAFARQPAGFRAFIPARLQQIKKEGLTSERVRLHGKNAKDLTLCERLLARLSVSDASAELPRLETDRQLYYPSRRGAREAANLTAAYNFAFSSLNERPISTELLLEIHSLLLKGTPRGKYAGRLRKKQNWVGGRRGPHSAVHVPPPPQELKEGMRDLEQFLSPDNPLPATIQAILASGQIELLHPFSDANGRLGRLLFLLVLASKGISIAPRLPLEACLRRHRGRYLFECTALQRASDWNPWISFMLQMLKECLGSLGDRGLRQS